MSQYGTGLRGEAQAEAYLCSLGMTVLARRYRAQDGEIDLIMQDGQTIVFVEVKCRPGARQGMGLLAVTPAKQRRMTHAALAWLVENQRRDCPVRFDAVEVTSGGLRHVPNAFMATR